MKGVRLATAVFCLVATLATAQAPQPVAERITVRRSLSIRVTLFSNRVVVLSARDNDEKVFMRQMTIPEGDYLVYLSALEKDATELEEEPVISDVSTSEGEVTLVLHVGPDAPRLVRFSPLASTTLPLSRIMGVLDDLHQQVLAASPSTDAMRDWKPRRGDRVQLLTGEYAIVREVWEEGLIVLEDEITYIRSMVLPDQRANVILRVVDTVR
jgi:hypothetical protein